MPAFNKILSTDEEKLRYVKKYLSSVNQRPLAILGAGGTGKTNVIRRAIENCKKNIAFQDNGSKLIFQKGEPNNNDFKMIIIDCNTSEEFMKQLEGVFNPIFIKFEPQELTE
jgi:hypothetical protein